MYHAFVWKKIYRKLLWLACRHHVTEIILKIFFSLWLGLSSSSKIPLFNRFENVKKWIEQRNYCGTKFKNDTKDFKDSTIVCLLPVYKSIVINDNYQETIKLTLLFLGSPPKKIRWRAHCCIQTTNVLADMLWPYNNAML